MLPKVNSYKKKIETYLKKTKQTKKTPYNKQLALVSTPLNMSKS